VVELLQDGEDSLGADLYDISLQEVLMRVHKSLTLDLNGRIQNFECALDEGDQDSCAKHQASINECSCQFHTSWRLPCRHMLAIIFQLVVSNSLESNHLISLIGDKWVLHGVDEAEKRHHLLRAFRPPGRALSSKTPQLASSDRIAILLSDFRVVADLASASDELMASVQIGISNLLQSLSGRRSQGPNVEIQDTHDFANDVSMQPSKDFLNLKLCMSHKWKPSDEEVSAKSLEPESREGAKLVGRHIAYKWGAFRSGGWHVAIVHAQLSKESGKNFDVSHPYSDDYVGPVSLDLKHYWNGEQYDGIPKHTWLLLVEQPLGSEVDKILAPPEAIRPGRPSTARLAPAFGPTSKAWGKRPRQE
jgi:hypothetical protein